jgi:hypothetical protein
MVRLFLPLMNSPHSLHMLVLHGAVVLRVLCPVRGRRVNGGSAGVACDRLAPPLDFAAHSQGSAPIRKTDGTKTLGRELNWVSSMKLGDRFDLIFRGYGHTYRSTGGSG